MATTKSGAHQASNSFELTQHISKAERNHRSAFFIEPRPLIKQLLTMNLRYLLAGLLCFILTSCSSNVDFSLFADSEKDALARSYIQSLIDGDYERLNQALDSSVRNLVDNDMWSQARSLYGQTELIDIRVVNYKTQSTLGGYSHYFFAYEHQFSDRWILTTVGLKESKSGHITIYNLQTMQPSDEPTRLVNEFSLANKTVIQYGFFILCVASPIFILSSFIFALLTKFPRRKWLWLIFILFGISKISMNWNTGELGFQLLNINLLGASSWSAGISSPWYLGFAFPLGAVCFWIKRRKLLNDQKQISTDSDIHSDG